MSTSRSRVDLRRVMLCSAGCGRPLRLPRILEPFLADGYRPACWGCCQMTAREHGSMFRIGTKDHLR